MTTATTFFTGVAGAIAIISLAIYLFGIPPELKRKLERGALKTMGENKLSHVAKGMLPVSTLTSTFALPHTHNLRPRALLRPTRPDQQDPYFRRNRPSQHQEGRQRPRGRRNPESTR